MELLEKVKELYPELGSTKTAKILKVRQSTISKIVSENNIEKNRRVNINDFYNIKSKEVCYFLGLLWADGHVSKKNNSISIECNVDDMIEFKKSLDVFGKWSYYDRKRERYGLDCKPVTNAYIYDSLLHDFLKENDYLDKSIFSPNKIISKIPEELIRYFLLGVIDGDGCFYFKENLSNQFTISGSEYQDWNYIEKLYIDLNIKYKIVKNNSSSTIRVTNKNDIKKIGDIVYSTIENDGIGLKRKYEKYKLIINSLLENEKIIEYIKNNKEKTIKQLSNDLKISNFRVKSIIRNNLQI